jgi:hypothetical protein
MGHPSEFYVRFLLAKGWSNGTETFKTVSVTLKNYGLLEISQEAFESIHDQFSPPPSFFFQNRKHPSTANFMREQKIYTMWAPKAEERAAVELIRLPLVREAIQILLMGHVSPEDIATRVGGKFNQEMTARAVQTYAHYFWNVDLCGFQEWAYHLHGNPMRDSYLSSLVGSPNQALYRAGFSPQINGKQALRETHRSLAMRIEATRRFPDTRDTALMLAALTKSFLDVHTALHGEGAGMEEMMKEFLKFKMERQKLVGGATTNVVSIRKLAAGGNFSGSGKKEDKVAVKEKSDADQ